jgi:UDP-N-acetylmuramoyl-tripeptide--D-alanyl-D-alanine ligase
VPTNLFSLAAWLKVLLRVYRKAIFTRDYPEKVIIEMGADHPGDIKYLTKVFKPKVGIILTVMPVHLAEFKNIEAVAAEKGELAKALPKNGKLILNIDDRRVREMAKISAAEVIYFGGQKGANFCFQNVISDLSGIKFEIVDGGEKETLTARVYGDHMIYPLVAAITAARVEGLTWAKISSALKEVKPFKGRMNILEGLRGSIIIDDSYNANPDSMKRALEFLKEQKGRKIGLLGNMNELGDYERQGHEEVGKVAAKSVDLLLTVGEIAKKYLATEAERSGLAPEKIISFTNSKEAGKWLKKRLKEGDIVLAKGSQNNVRMEQAVSEILKEPKLAKKILVRQSSFWK